MALVSPGVQVTVTDESFFSSAGPGTVPLIIITTAQDKLTPDGTGTAVGTTADNADKLFLMASQRELLQTFGDPNFNEIGGTAQNGYPLNEFGLLAAYSYLGAANRAYIVRADIDLSELDPTSVAPTAAPANDTYWLDTDSTVSGLFRRSQIGTWEEVITLTKVNTTTAIVAGTDTEPSSGFQDGSQIINFDDTGVIQYLERVAGVWQIIGGATWRAENGGDNDFQWAPHAAEPTAFKSDGSTALDVFSYWLKTTTPNAGLNFSLSHYDSTLGQFVTDTVTDVEDNHTAYYLLSTVGSTNIIAGTVVGFIDQGSEVTNDDGLSVGSFTGTSESRPLTPQTASEADISLEIHNGNSTTVLNGGTADLAYSDPSTIIINGVTSGNLNDNSPYTDIAALIAEFNSAGFGLPANVVASLNSTADGITLTNSSGLDIVIGDTFTGDAGNAGFSSGVTSNFTVITTFVADPAAPTGATTAGTYWYDPSFIVDILVNNGAGVWGDVTGTILIQSDEPVSGLTVNDIWVETDNVDDYPVLYRRNATNDAWVLVDNADQTTSAGVVFADARPAPVTADTTGTGINNGTTGTDPDLDADRPDPLLFPGGVLLFNTRYSGRNVKIWTEDATTDDGAGVVLVDRWVSASGNNADGSLITGQRAQRAVITDQVAAVLVGNEEIRDDTIFFNLISAPGFTELIDEMVALNVDRKEQGFVIGDSPFNLSNSTTDLQAWSSNSANAVGNGEDGLVTADSYLGVYYPSGLSTNVDGSEVVVPPSHMILRVMAQNDQQAYPWYAPAGFTRGTVSNASAVGFLDSEDEFVSVSLTQGQRDTLQQNNVNPIANIPNRGLVVFGQKTRQATASALDRVNVARLINHIRFQSDQLAQPFLFEPNDSVTRGAVKDAFDAFLSELVTLRGLNDFLVVVDESNNTPARIDNNELWIDIAVQPIKSVEFIFIPIRIRNTGDDLNL